MRFCNAPGRAVVIPQAQVLKKDPGSENPARTVTLGGLGESSRGNTIRGNSWEGNLPLRGSQTSENLENNSENL